VRERAIDHAREPPGDVAKGLTLAVGDIGKDLEDRLALECGTA
jgi:hypothetical protein